jgi:hypothetical protein
MKVLWLHPGGPGMASYRYRTAIPAGEMKKLGHETFVNAGEGDIVVFGKPVPNDMKTLERAKGQAKTVVDFCDDHFEHSELGPVYQYMAQNADAITCPTNAMRNRIHSLTGKDAHVIPDCYEMPHNDPHADGEKLLWFGHPSNIPELQTWFPYLCGTDLTVVTGENRQVQYLRWSPQTTIQQLQLANIVLLPTSPKKDTKSANRLLEAINAGCFPVCGNLEAYEEFKDFVWVGNIYTGLQWTRAFRSELNQRLTEAQKYITRYSPESIGQQWAHTLASV